MPDTIPPPLETELGPSGSPEPVELRTALLGGLLLLAALAACYAAAEIVLPIVLAFVLNAVFRPVLRALEQIRLPRVAAALLIVLALVSLFVVLGLLLSAPIAELPHTLPRLQERLRFLSPPIHSLQRTLEQIQNLAPGTAPLPVAASPTPLPLRLLEEIRRVAAGAFTTLVALFFILVSGELFLRRLVELLPGFKEKRQAVDISQQIERDISIYLATITLMNGLVGVATGGMAWACGLGDPLLWGTLAFLLNYVPVLGPATGVLVFLVAGLVTIDPLWAAFLPPALYLAIHVAEGETVTPMLLAARFTVNPVLVILGVIFWYWMWGVVGAVLATPMLAIAKIVCDRIDRLKPIGHFVGG